MSGFDDRHIDFVARHYKEGAFDTQKAISRFQARCGVSSKVRRFGWKHVGVAAAAAVLLVVSGLFHYIRKNEWTEVMADGAATVCLLPDSSRVTLADGATLRYRFKDSRKVEMTGKAYFLVTPDPASPFEVTTGNSYVRVLGTSFQIDATAASGKAVEVYVSSGKVLFARSADTDGVILEKGTGATLPDGMSLPVVDTKDKINSIAWQRGTFIFDDTPLKEVLNTLSKHYKVSFVCTDLSKRLSGEFSTDDLNLIISLIESALDVNIMKM